jgi:hypothetical protein
MAYLSALELIAEHKIWDSDCLFTAVRIIGRRVLAWKRSREAVCGVPEHPPVPRTAAPNEPPVQIIPINYKEPADAYFG